VALVIGTDSQGPWVAVECDRRNCFAHVAIRPAASDFSYYDLACIAFDQALEESWRLMGRTYCPLHALERHAERPRIGDGYSWADVRMEGVKGGQRPA
jgi:hypothetical protein